MKKYKVILLFFISSVFNINSQTDPGHYKEHYDDLMPAFYNTSGTALASPIGDGLSWTMSGLLNMYKTTGDKAYLIKFINLSLFVQKNRYDDIYPGDPNYPPKWTLTCPGECESTYQNGVIICPMAEFVYLVYTTPDLYNTNLPLSIISDDLPSSPVILGYGDYANWLGKRIEETIMYINAYYWDDNFGLRKNQMEDKIGGINWQSYYAATMLYMALIPNPSGFGYGDNRPLYLARARKIAALYKGNVFINDDCNNIIYFNPVLLPHSNDSYYWYLRTWGDTKRVCAGNPFILNHYNWYYYSEFIEDVAHGAMSIVFPRVCYEHNLTPPGSSTNYFGVNEMMKFRNTFAYNIFDYTNNIFHNNVYGTDGPITDNPGIDPNQFATSEVLNWMPLQKLDYLEPDVNHKVYSIIKKQFDYLMANDHVNAILPSGYAASTNLKYLSGYTSYLGLSEIVKAQWENECVNLLLKKRKLIYDQDFVVKNSITVDPSVNNTLFPSDIRPFAEPNSDIVGSPTYFVANEFLIEPGIISNMIAGEEITFRPGFNAKSGCAFSASINSNDCSDGRSMANIENIRSDDNDVTAFLDRKSDYIKNLSELNIYPNPSGGDFKISLSINNEPSILKEIKIYDVIGNEIWGSSSPSFIFNVNLVSYSKGLYYIRGVNLAGEIITKIVVKE
jgi:hypothetical protein